MVLLRLCWRECSEGDELLISWMASPRSAAAAGTAFRPWPVAAATRAAAETTLPALPCTAAATSSRIDARRCCRTSDALLCDTLATAASSASIGGISRPASLRRCSRALMRRTSACTCALVTGLLRSSSSRSTHVLDRRMQRSHALWPSPMMHLCKEKSVSHTLRVKARHRLRDSSKVQRKDNNLCPSCTASSTCNGCPRSRLGRPTKYHDELLGAARSNI